MLFFLSAAAPRMTPPSLNEIIPEHILLQELFLGKPAAKSCVASEHWEDQGWQQMQREIRHHIKVKDLEVPNAEGS